MRVSVLAAIVVRLFSTSTSPLAAAKRVDDVVSQTIPDFILADIADKAASALATQSTNLPAYCYHASDYDCYKKGVPKCCTNSDACPSSKPGCDRSGTRTHTSGLLDYCFDYRDYTCYRDGVPKCCTKSKPNCKSDKPGCNRRTSSKTRIPAGNYCNASVDTCVREYDCIDGICQRVSGSNIGKGGVCRVGVDVCVKGTACVNGRCSVPSIPAGGVCNTGDVCVLGYYCNNGRCERNARRVIRGGGVCQPNDACETGYTCVGGRCSVPAGGICKPGDICETGYSCINGRCDPTSRIIPRNGVCQTGDMCENGFTCVGGRCTIPPIPLGGVCTAGDVCVEGGICLDGVCSAPMWYTNWQYCVMSCPLSANPCCGGYAQSWDQAYSSAEACCNQSAFQGNHSGCLNRSLQCAGEDSQDIAKSD